MPAAKRDARCPCYLWSKVTFLPLQRYSCILHSKAYGAGCIHHRGPDRQGRFQMCYASVQTRSRSSFKVRITYLAAEWRAQTLKLYRRLSIVELRVP